MTEAALRYVLIANPGSPRCEAFRQELLSYRDSGGRPLDFEIVPWSEVVSRGGNLDGLSAFALPAVVRLESPGKSNEVYRRILGRTGTVPAPWDPGQLVCPGQWYRGFCDVLEGLYRSFCIRPHLRLTACPLSVVEMFDKNATLATLAKAEIPVPDWLPAESIPSNARSLLDRLREKGWTTAYVKLNSGSSATGIVFVQIAGRGMPGGLTTLRFRDGKAFNTRRIRILSGDKLRAALEFVLDDGATVQRGVPLATVQGSYFDLRVVCVDGKPIARLFRTAPQQITNLHLGGRRGDFAACRKLVPDRIWADALDAACRAAGRFDCNSAGVDVAFAAGFGSFRVLEVNAFGNFFPGWCDPAGRSLHWLQIASDLALRRRPVADPSG